MISIPLDDIHRIEEYDTSRPRGGKMMELSRDCFLFSFYMRGMNMADVFKLKKEQISGGRLLYQRSKSHGDFSVPLHEKALAIILKYEGSSKLGYMFPVIKHKDPELAYKDMRTNLRAVNKWIKVIAVDLGIEVKLVSYTARHSFAGIAKNELKVPTEFIKEALGHESFDVTEFYLNRFDDDVLDDSFSKMFD